MNINFIIVPFIIIIGLLLSPSNNNNNNQYRLFYICLCSLVLLFFASMRSPEWLTYTYEIDTKEYKDHFERIRDLSWEEIWNRFLLRYAVKDSETDIGYEVLAKSLSYFASEFYIFSLIADLIFFIPFGIILYRFSSNNLQIMFGFLFYVALIQTFLLGGARQIFAIGLDLMAFLFISDRKIIGALICLVLGITIHFSSFIFLLPVILIWINIKGNILKVSHFISFLLIPIILSFPNQILLFMGSTAGLEKYTAYGEEDIRGGAFTFIFLIELLSLFLLWAIRTKDIDSSKAIRNFYVMTPFFTLFAPLIYSSGSMIRIALYFYIFLVLLVPFAIECRFKQNRNLVYFIVISSLAILILRDPGIEYYFFWER